MTANRRIFLNIIATYGRSLYALVIGLFCGLWTLMALGPAGQYTLMVSPHKLSPYLASGLPVIVNEYAAIASFAKDNQVGIAVKLLRDLPERLKAVTNDEYTTMANNCQGLAKKLRDGYFTKQAIESAIRRIAV